MKKGELAEYSDLLADIRNRVRQAQHRAILSANGEMHFMSWDVGRMIASRQQEEGWGAKVIARLAVDLQNELLEEKGFSPTNLKRMVRFWSEYPGLSAIGARNVRQIAAEYSLRDMEKPIGVADYELTRALPEKLASSLPSIEAIEAELAHQLGETDS